MSTTSMRSSTSIRPAGAPDHTQDAPGRMGKKMRWVSLSVAAWPALRAVAGDENFANFREDESKAKPA